ncbi:MAG: Ig-like domain-containing protein, partial [Terriglobales bacterium]
TYSVKAVPTQGTLSGTAPNLTYTPYTGYLGSDKFTFVANDGTSNSNVATVSISVQGPVVVTSVGYLNGSAGTSNPIPAFNSSGSSTLVAFVSTCALWNGQAVSISGLSDSVGNTWNVLTGPTEWVGTSCPLLSTIYYVNNPNTSATHTVTVAMTNPGPLVADIFAVAGSDTTGPPIFSAITDPGPGGTSATVTTAPITVPSYSLLLSWVKNDTAATATALDGYTLDPSSTSFLWAETQAGVSAGSHTGQFQYSASIGWQTAIVGLKPIAVPPPTPSITSNPANPTNQTSASFSFSDTQAGVSYLCQLDGSAFSACTSPQAYAGPLSQGSHTFAVEAQDPSLNVSTAASYTWNIITTPPPAPSITSNPANPTNQTSASFSFSDTQAGVSYLCQLDGSAFSACTSPQVYAGPLSQASHTFAVEAKDTAGNVSTATSFTWVINTTPPPAPSITSNPANPTNQTSASFSFSDTQAGVSYLCQLDGSAFS